MDIVTIGGGSKRGDFRDDHDLERSAPRLLGSKDWEKVRAKAKDNVIRADRHGSLSV